MTNVPALCIRLGQLGYILEHWEPLSMSELTGDWQLCCDSQCLWPGSCICYLLLLLINVPQNLVAENDRPGSSSCRSVAWVWVYLENWTWGSRRFAFWWQLKSYPNTWRALTGRLLITCLGLLLGRPQDVQWTSLWHLAPLGRAAEPPETGEAQSS